MSALVPTFNRRPQIFRAIDSIISQSVPVDEIIVVDDGSTDGTGAAIREKYGDRVRIFTQENGGVSVARKRAVDQATSDWVAFLDSDDEWTPGRNALFSSAASQVSQKVALIFGNTQIVGDTGTGPTVFDRNGFDAGIDLKVIVDPLSSLTWKADQSQPVVIQSSFIRRSVLTELQCFGEGLRHSEEFLAGLQIATRYSFASIPQVVTNLYRTSDLADSSLEQRWSELEDHQRAQLLAYDFAAVNTGKKIWATRYEHAVRNLCKWRASKQLSVRGLAFQQFKYGYSARSLLFFCAAMFGGGFFRLGFAAKRALKTIPGRVSAH